MLFSDRRQPSLVVTGMMVFVFGMGHAFAQTLVDLPVGSPGPLEQMAQPITLENPLPSRLLGGPPVYPGEAMGTGAAGTMVFRLMIDDAGTVAEARYIGHTRYALREVRGKLEAAPMLDSTFLAVAEDAVRGWLYEPPVSAPIAIDVEFVFAGDGRVRVVWQGPAPPPVVPPVSETAPPTVARFEVGEILDRLLEPLNAGNVPPPSRLKGTSPIYPPEALAQHIEGAVLVELLIDATGRVADTRVLRGQPQLAPAAVDAVRQWEFAPTVVDGTPTPVVITTVVNFTQAR
jgi:TonB family protein